MKPRLIPGLCGIVGSPLFASWCGAAAEKEKEELKTRLCLDIETEPGVIVLNPVPSISAALHFEEMARMAERKKFLPSGDQFGIRLPVMTQLPIETEAALESLHLAAEQKARTADLVDGTKAALLAACADAGRAMKKAGMSFDEAKEAAAAFAAVDLGGRIGAATAMRYAVALERNGHSRFEAAARRLFGHLKRFQPAAYVPG